MKFIHICGRGWRLRHPLIIFFIIVLLTLNIFIPIIFLHIFNMIEEDSISSYFEISLYISETGEIRKIPFEEYIKQVTYAEMPAIFELEAIKAQTIAIRSYTYRKLQTQNHINADMCTDINHCQAWKEKDNTENYRKIAQAVEETNGMVALYDGEVINAVYHAASGGFTENSINVWSSQEKYLVSVESPKEDEIMQNYETEVIISKKDFMKKLELKNSKKLEIKILSRTEGNRVKEILINKKSFSGNKIREIFNLRSSNFDISYKDNEIKFAVKGYGHGVGLSQWGAQAMALDGKNYKEIIKHYYQGVEINTIDFV